MKKKLVSLFLAFVLCMMPVFVFAAEDSENGGGGGVSTTGAAGKDIYDITPDGTVTVDTDVSNAVGNVLGLVRWIGFIVAIVMVMYVGIKYLTAGAGQKAEVKSTMVPMLVGAAMVGLAPTLVSWIWGIFAN